MKRLALLALPLLAACAVPPETRGELYEVTDNMVTIRGAINTNILVAGEAAPTPAMIAQAREVCPNAQYMSAAPSDLHQYDMDFLFKFRCP